MCSFPGLCSGWTSRPPFGALMLRTVLQDLVNRDELFSLVTCIVQLRSVVLSFHLLLVDVQGRPGELPAPLFSKQKRQNSTVGRGKAKNRLADLTFTVFVGVKGSQLQASPLSPTPQNDLGPERGYPPRFCHPLGSDHLTRGVGAATGGRFPGQGRDGEKLRRSPPQDGGQGGCRPWGQGGRSHRLQELC